MLRLNGAGKKAIAEIYLRAIDSMLAAHRFYGKNGFVEIDKALLPEYSR
jgi:hypothetical protein